MCIRRPAKGESAKVGMRGMGGEGGTLMNPNPPLLQVQGLLNHEVKGGVQSGAVETRLDERQGLVRVLVLNTRHVMCGACLMCDVCVWCGMVCVRVVNVGNPKECGELCAQRRGGSARSNRPRSLSRP